MSVATTKQWNSRRFKNLSSNAILLYIYLTTTPLINYLGVICQSPEDIKNSTKLSLEEIREATKELINQKDLHVIKVDQEIFFIIPAHFSTIGKADTILAKIKSNLAELPEEVRELLNEIGISSDKKRKVFNKPTAEEVEEYTLSLGFYIDPVNFIKFYEDNPKSNEDFWYDGKGKIVSDWRAKIRNVWSKRAQEVKFPEGAPKGFETFHIKNDDGSIIVPDFWKDDEPKSKNFILNNKLKQAYDRLLCRS